VAVLRKEEILDLAENAVKFASGKGAEEAEAFVYQGLATAINIERGQIAKSARIIDHGVGVRIIANRAIGFSYTNILNDTEAINETVLRALNSAKASKPDKDWKSLPEKKTFPVAKGTYDKQILELSSENLVDTASTMLDVAERTDKRVFPIEGGVGASYNCKAVANTNGVLGFDEGTVAECSLATIAREGNEVTPVCFEFDGERIYTLDPEWVGKEATRLAASALNARTVETKSTKVVFTQFALQELLYFTLINALKADFVQRNQSALKGKIGEKVASDGVTIFDDGLFEGGMRTWKFDSEGVPQQKTPLIEKGVLRNFIYDNYTAKKEGKQSTGNAARNAYLSTPTLDATNFRIMPGTMSADELLSGVKDGLLVSYLQGAHSSNPASGDFSVVATPAWKIKNGEIAHAVKGAMVAGNMFDVLKNVSALANNERKVGPLVAPWILVENVKVIGK
jgi:PmbA protein